MIRNTHDSYGIISQILHWVIGFFIIILLSVGFYIESLPNSPEKSNILSIHKATGVLVLMLVFVRIIWRLSNIQPSIPNSNILLAKLANINIFFLYFLMVAMPISGITSSLMSGHDISFYGIFSIKAVGSYSTIAEYAGFAHGIMAFIFVTLITLHIIAALYHHFILKDNILRRMINKN